MVWDLEQLAISNMPKGVNQEAKDRNTVVSQIRPLEEVDRLSDSSRPAFSSSKSSTLRSGQYTFSSDLPPYASTTIS